MSQRIGVPIELEGFDVGSAEVINGKLTIEVSSNRRPACIHCGSVAVIGHGRHTRRLRDRSCGRPTVLVWSQRRLRCKDCGRTSRERHPEAAGSKSITRRFRRHLFEQAIARPFTHVAASEGVSCYRVVEAFESHAADQLLGPIDPPRVISLDESAFRRRFKFHSIVSNPEAGEVLEIFYGRDQATVTATLAGLNPHLRAGIETVVMDLFWPYRKAVEAVLPQARIVVDKFHVLASMDQAAQKVRREHGRMTRRERLGRGGGLAPRQVIPANDPVIFGVRWVFMKRFHKLTLTEGAWLENVFRRAAPELRAAWLLKESFAAIYDAGERTEAERRLDAWIHNMKASGIKEFADTWRTLQHWRDQILNYFDDPVTNAFAEGITKIKVIKRTSYGFRDKERYRRKILLSCGRRRRQGR